MCITSTVARQQHWLLLLCMFFTIQIQKGQGQNVGIGTTNPQAKLDVVSSIRVGGVSKYLLYDSSSGKFIWNNSTLFVPTLQQIIQHSASGEGLYYGGGKLMYRGVSDTAFFTDWGTGNGYFRGQLGLGTYTPDPTAVLEIQSTDKGILIPRLTSTQRLAIATPANGLIVYDTNQRAFYYWDGFAWYQLSIESTVWSLFGNSGTNPGINYIGNRDNIPLFLKINNETVGFFGGLNNGNVFLGRLSGKNIYFGTGHSNVAIGANALFTAIPSSSNQIAIGDSALYKTTTGQGNASVGSQSLYSNLTGSNNSAQGTGSLISNISGNNNTAYGTGSLRSNTTGNSNTAIGSYADVWFPNLTNATAIGANARVACSNCMMLGSLNVRVGIGVDSPIHKLEVNGSIRQTTYSTTISIVPNGAIQYAWNHNLGYQPVIMISLDQTGGGGCDYVNFSYGHFDNNNLIIYLTNRNVSGTATGKVRWIVVY